MTKGMGGQQQHDAAGFFSYKYLVVLVELECGNSGCCCDCINSGGKIDGSGKWQQSINQKQIQPPLSVLKTNIVLSFTLWPV